MATEPPTTHSAEADKEALPYLSGGFLVGGGRFSLLRELARGGMGVVWLAHDERLVAPVALKFLPEQIRNNPAALNGLRMETQRSRILSHPNIIRIYDLYEAPEEAPFISMEYVDGPSLWTLRLQQPKGRFSWAYLKPLVRQLCEALDYAHGERVIHRDLKPANMLLDERRRLRLADFGIAARTFEPSAFDPEKHGATGTLSYMSPQQLEGGAACVTDDIYALGATLYELLTGNPPFYQHNIAYQAVNVLPTSLEERLADLEIENDVPPAVAAMVMACLAKEPEKRPQSARAVAQWIGLGDSKILPSNISLDPAQPSPDPSEALAPEKKSNLGAAVAVMVGIIGLGLVIWMAWDGFNRKPAESLRSGATNQTTVAESAGTSPTNATRTVISLPPVSRKSASLELGGVNQESGLREVTGMDDGATWPVTIDGKECRLLSSRPRARGYFQILPAFKQSGPVNATVQIEYFSGTPGVIQLQYDGVDPTPAAHYTSAGKIDFDGEGGWKTANFKLENALFKNGETGGADFRLTTLSAEVYIHSITLFFDN